MIVRGLTAEVILLVHLLFTTVPGAPPRYSVEALPQYDAMFCRAAGWTGADGAYSVALAGELTLWLYSDTWIGNIVDGKHKDATMVNNSIALQQGKDALAATVEFYWRTTEDGKPAAFVEPADGVGWFWIADGIMAGEKLYFFLMQIIRTGEKGVFGFKHIGTHLAEVENPHDDPLRWRVKQHKIPYGRYSNNGNLFFGSAVMMDGIFVYIYGSSEDWSRGMSGRSMIVARVPHDRIADFDQWRFFTDGHWQPDITCISELFDGLATEYSVSYRSSIKQYVAVYTEYGMSRNIMMRLAPTPVGPWSRAFDIYECPEYGWHKTYFCYAAKGHPEISSEDELIVTYVCNSRDFWQMAKDARIYRPCFLRIKFDL